MVRNAFAIARFLAVSSTAAASAAPASAAPESAAPASAAPAPAPVRTPATPRHDVAGLPNFAMVAPGLYRSAQPTALGMRSAKALGIKTVINLRTFHSDRDELRGTGLGYFHIHAKAWHPEEEDIVAFLAVALNPANQPVLVHCQHGSDRTGMMVAAYRRVVEGWSVDEAMAELPVFGFHEVWASIRSLLAGLDPAALQAASRALPAPRIRVIP